MTVDRNSSPVVLDVLPQQVADLRIGGQRHSAAVDVLDSNLIRKHKVQVLLHQGVILGATKSRQADLFSIHGVRPEIFLLDGIKLLTATLRHIDAENSRPQIGVDGIDIFASSPEVETAFGLRDKAIRVETVSE